MTRDAARSDVAQAQAPAPAQTQTQTQTQTSLSHTIVRRTGR